MTEQILSRTERAQLAMVLEVCAYPKPGNVDRCHDYEDTWLEHFIASAVFVRPALERAEAGGAGLGALLKEATVLTTRHRGGNTHFGAFLLLFPLVMGGDIPGAVSVCEKTTVQDALDFYEAFSMIHVRMHETDELDVNDPASRDLIRTRGMTLADIMAHSAPHDMVAREWENGFARTRRAADLILGHGPGRRSVVDAFLSLLAEEPDTFIAKKHGEALAAETMMLARDVQKDLLSIEEFDRICLSRGANPGSTADLIIAGIYVALGEGWQWDF
jgi:triphosphoribosyl-dephospho-CoA synthase